MAVQLDRAPRVLDISWGHMRVEGLDPGKDFKLYPGGGRPWDWSETGTQHFPGIQPADVEELLAHGATAVVLSQGMQSALRVAPETMARLEAAGVAIYIVPTQQAVEIYNRLAESEPVGGLFHSTC